MDDCDASVSIPKGLYMIPALVLSHNVCSTYAYFNYDSTDFK